MTMKVYDKIQSGTKRQALAKLTYGQGTLAPEHVVEYPAVKGKTVPIGHQPVTGEKERQAN
jgi:hypothetical protein